MASSQFLAYLLMIAYGRQLLTLHPFCCLPAQSSFTSCISAILLLKSTLTKLPTTASTIHIQTSMSLDGVLYHATGSALPTTKHFSNHAPMETQPFCLHQAQLIPVFQLLVTWQTNCIKWQSVFIALASLNSLKIHQLFLPLNLIMILGHKESWTQVIGLPRGDVLSARLTLDGNVAMLVTWMQKAPMVKVSFKALLSVLSVLEQGKILLSLEGWKTTWHAFRSTRKRNRLSHKHF